MSQPENNKSFMDRGTIIALVLVIIFWLGWSRFMDAKYPNKPATQAVATSTQGVQNSGETVNAAAEGGKSISAATAAVGGTPPTSEVLTDFADATWGFQISSMGMGLKKIDLKNFTTRENTPIIMADVAKDLPFATFDPATGSPVAFEVSQTGPGVYTGHGTYNGGEITKTLTIDSAHYLVGTDIVVKGAGAAKPLGTFLTEPIAPPSHGGIFNPSRDHQEFFVYHEDKKTRHLINPEKGLEAADSGANVIGLSQHYFATAILDSSDITPRFEAKVTPGSKIAEGRVIYEPVNHADTFTVHYKAFAGPKTFAVLQSIDDRMTGLIDYGTFAIIARPLLWLMHIFFSMFGNWGWAIIASTLVVRLIVMPFNVYSFRSMKVMQKIQPEMKAMREKFKDDPMRMNAETMALMKKNKANPLGGCLPMLLQLPVFFAFYQVLGQSIELYQAPFIFWLHDLSSKDPFYVLPILMGATMFMQQKLTPTAVDPQQAKIMMFMPVLFTFFMVSLPSGLALYMFVSTGFGVAQQYLFLRDRSTTTPVLKARSTT